MARCRFLEKPPPHANVAARTAGDENCGEEDSKLAQHRQADEFDDEDLGVEHRRVEEPGVAEAELSALLEGVRALPLLRVAGLMTMPAPSPDPEASRPAFAKLRALCDRLGLAECSMGMSDDFEVAVEEGATRVRIGTALFGERGAA